MRKFSKDPDAISRLSPEQYRVTQQNGTEAPGTADVRTLFVNRRVVTSLHS